MVAFLIVSFEATSVPEGDLRSAEQSKTVWGVMVGVMTVVEGALELPGFRRAVLYAA